MQLEKYSTQAVHIISEQLLTTIVFVTHHPRQETMAVERSPNIHN